MKRPLIDEEYRFMLIHAPDSLSASLARLYLERKRFERVLSGTKFFKQLGKFLTILSDQFEKITI